MAYWAHVLYSGAIDSKAYSCQGFRGRERIRPWARRRKTIALRMIGQDGETHRWVHPGNRKRTRNYVLGRRGH